MAGLPITTDWDVLKIPKGYTATSKDAPKTQKSSIIRNRPPPLRQKKPKSEVRMTTYNRQAKRPYSNVADPDTLSLIRERNFTVATVIDVVSSDRTKGGWEWKPMDPAHQTTTEEQESIDLAEMLLSNPNHLMTGKDLLKAVNEDLETFADSFIEIVYTDMLDAVTGEFVYKVPTQLWPIPAGTVEIMPADETGSLPPSDGPEAAPAYVQWVNGKKIQEWYADEIIHIQANNINSRLYGVPKLLSVIILVATQMESIKYNYKTFSGEKVPRQIVTIDTSHVELERMLEDAKKRLDDDPKAVEFLAGKGAQALKMMESNRDMEFLGLTKYMERSICARWRLPPVAIGISEAGGAGIVVGKTQVDKYWDMIEEGNEQIAEQLTRWFRSVFDITSHYLEFPSQRPEDEEAKARIEDTRIKNNTLTVNEARRERGLPPVPYGDQAFSPMGAQAAPALFSMDPLGSVSQPGGKYLPGPPDFMKAVSPARQDHDILQLDPETAKEIQAYAGRLVGLFLQMRREMLTLANRNDIILNPPEGEKKKKARKAQGTTQEAILAEAKRIADKYNVLMDEASKEELLEAYLTGKANTALELETGLEFTAADISALEELQTAWAATSIRSFTSDQVRVIENSLAQVAAQPDLFTFRNLVEDAMGENLWKEQWKLDRIARTSLGRTSFYSRGQQFRDSTKTEDPEVIWNSPMDPPRARREHMKLNKTKMKLSEAMRIKNRAVNCRCWMTLAQKLPEGVPKPENLVKDIREARAAADQKAREQWLGGGA